MVAALVAVLSLPAHSAAQDLPPAGYLSGGAYYVPNDPPAAAQAAATSAAICPVGYGLPTVYVASTTTMVRIYQFWPVGGDAPGFPYVPVYASQARC